jgi:putative Mg2+ transporter-C (MgtC) family protein
MEITETLALTRLGISLLLGGAIGFERNVHKHPAGMRTFMLICLGSTLATLASIYICQTNLGLHNGDPGRIAAQILTGIGFIGAGLIIKTNDGVSGITTASSIFMTAAIGITVGVGMVLTSVVVTAVTLVILSSGYYHRKRMLKKYSVEQDIES